jgi:hypothetical protein
MMILCKCKQKGTDHDDGSPTEFYQTFCDVIKGDLLNIFYKFQHEELQLFQLNLGSIIFPPKK